MPATVHAGWRAIPFESLAGPMNMALDEVAAESAGSGGPATARVYGWETSTLSLGYNQDPATVDWAFCDREGITVTRRQTGGGAVYHDARADVSYAVALPRSAVPDGLRETYERLVEPVLETLRRLGVDADFATREVGAAYEPACYLRAIHPAHDVVGPDGRKVSGNAQYRRRDAVLQHGSLTLSTRPRTHCACFTGGVAGPGPDPETFTERVAGLEEYVDVSRDRVIEVLQDTLSEWAGARSGSWSTGERERARSLVAEKYATGEWTRNGERPGADGSA